MNRLTALYKAFFTAIFAILILVVSTISAEPETGNGEVWLLDLNGPVGPASADYLLRGFANAEQAGAIAVILRMDTPGGLDTAMRDIIHGILASNIPVIGYVAPQGSRAASAGTYILYACHIAAMAPATNLGAATPVQIGGSNPGLPGMEEPPAKEKESEPEPQSATNEGDKASDDVKSSPAQRAPSNSDAMRNKVVNDARAYIRGLAELRGRNADWAEMAVSEAATLTASEALEKNVIDLVAVDTDDLLTALNGRPVSVGEATINLDTSNVTLRLIEPDWRTRFLNVITNPNVAFILMMVGIYGLILEFSNPGIGAGGVVGAICLLLALYALQLLPISYSALALMLLGLGLMMAEALTPSFGLFGVGGIIAFIFGAIMLMDTDVPGFQIALPLILAFAVVTAGLLILLVGLLLKTRHQPAVSGIDTLLGQEAVVTEIRDNGIQIKVQGEIWSASSDQTLAVGDTVRINSVSGLLLEVVKK